MTIKDTKRSYRNSLEFVERGLRACWQNAVDLKSASQKLIEAGMHAPSLSLSVLALEELENCLRSTAFYTPAPTTTSLPRLLIPIEVTRPS